MSLVKKRSQFGCLLVLRWLLPALLTWLPQAARAAEAVVSVTCPEWAPETAGQVEARIRASLLLEDRGVSSVAVSCEAGGASVSIDGERGPLLRPVVRTSSSLEDDVIATLERALEELRPVVAAPAAPVAAPPASEATEPPPVPAPSRPAPRTTLKKKAAGRSRAVQLEAGVPLERWSNHWAWGGQAGLSYGDAQLQYGLVLAGRAALDEDPSFQLNEWTAAARVQWSPRQGLGFRGSASLGASAFVVQPAAGVATDSATLLGSAFLELGVSRPIWLGNLALAPAFGARFFSGSRRVRVNQQEVLKLPLLAPQLLLTLIARFPL